MLLVRVVCKMLMTVLICDGPGSGFQIIGLFANSADAQSYAKDHRLKDWRLAEVISRSAFEEAQVATASKAHLCLFSAAAAASSIALTEFFRQFAQSGFFGRPVTPCADAACPRSLARSVRRRRAERRGAGGVPSGLC